MARLRADTGKFEFFSVPLANHPMFIMLPRFRAPGIFVDADRGEENFRMSGTWIGRDGKSWPEGIPEDGHELMIFNPSQLCRSIAKMAHGAAVAELGTDAFTPWLPEIILGRDHTLLTP